jgi:hypothetical protein
MHRNISYLLLLISLSLFTGCEEKLDPKYDQENFTKIYDTNQFDKIFYPMDVKQTPDGGYLILAGHNLDDSNYTGITLLKADQYGEFEKTVEIDTLMNPVGDLMSIEGNYYFFCMNSVANTRLVKTDATLGDVQWINLSNDLSYPAAASLDDASLLLLSYDNNNRQSVVSIVSSEGTVADSKRFDIEASDEIEGPIINHFIRTGRKFPLQIGRIPGGSYFFNGFYNYTLSFVLTNLGDDNDVDKVVYGQQNDGGMSALLPFADEQFAAARFNFGDNYFLPSFKFDDGATVMNTTDLEGNPLIELNAGAKVKIISATINSKNVLIYASDTKSNQIGLFFYDQATHAFLSSRYLGSANAFELSSIIQTSDNGLALCGTTYVAGRFPRICLFKISEKELQKNVKGE